MRAARYTQGGGLTFETVSVPEPGEGELLLRTVATSLCGTDLKIVRHGHRRLRDGQTITLGHEFVGEVTAAGRGTEGFTQGMLVGVAPNLGCGVCPACRRGLMNMCPDYTAFGVTFDGSHTEYVRVPAAALTQGCVLPIPSGVSPAAAALAEPLSCVVNGQRIVRLEPGESVLIYGAGPMGLLHVLLARASGAARIFVADIDDGRLAVARQLGATDTCNSTRETVPAWIKVRTGGRGLEVAITAAPIAALQNEALSVLAPYGRLSLFAGLPNKSAGVELDTNAIHYRALTVTGTTGGSPADYRTALAMIASGRVDVRAVISHVYPLSQVDRAYATAHARVGRKIMMVRDDFVAAIAADGLTTVGPR